ncbi:hypothetical protein B0H34DRAFT_771872 [Crassisporium funariophilum]|nr:hypothetical protein B0H34DRAFT_771872 [Crassisporium funariophilum]
MVIYLIDVTTLQTMAFDHEDPEGRSLRAILQSEKTTKLFYDVRNDADALFNIYNINIANVYDLQLLDLAVQRSAGRPMRFVNGLARSIDAYLQPPLEWMRVKEEGVALFAPEKGGSYEIFDKRPMDPRIIAYCAQDVALLFELETGMEQRMGRVGKNWKSRVTTASAGRVGEARSSIYQGKGRHRAIAPMI